MPYNAMKKRAYVPENRFMERALDLAREAFEAGEVPVGAVVVKDGEVIGCGRNRREEDRSVLGHAEIEAMTAAAEDLSNVDVEALNAAIAALSGAAENLTAVDMQVLNQAIASLSGAAENLQGLDIETLNQLVASLETVAANLERTSKAITGIFGR